jgi:hypothetical protein
MPKTTNHKPTPKDTFRYNNPSKINKRTAVGIAGLRKSQVLNSLALHLAITPNKLQQQFYQGLYNDCSFE